MTLSLKPLRSSHFALRLPVLGLLGECTLGGLGDTRCPGLGNALGLAAGETRLVAMSDKEDEVGATAPVALGGTLRRPRRPGGGRALRRGGARGRFSSCGFLTRGRLGGAGKWSIVATGVRAGRSGSMGLFLAGLGTERRVDRR